MHFCLDQLARALFLGERPTPPSTNERVVSYLPYFERPCQQVPRLDSMHGFRLHGFRMFVSLDCVRRKCAWTFARPASGWSHQN